MGEGGPERPIGDASDRTGGGASAEPGAPRGPPGGEPPEDVGTAHEPTPFRPPPPGTPDDKETDALVNRIFALPPEPRDARTVLTDPLAKITKQDVNDARFAR